MQNIFDYAGCDRNANSCRGPKRVAAFKEKANQFFDPYETVLNEIYDALILAQTLGVDITDIYMMLNGSCNVWGKYLCEPCNPANGAHEIGNGVVHACSRNGSKSNDDWFYEVAKDCKDNSNCKVASVQHKCTLMQMLNNGDEVQQNWLDMDAGSSGGIRVACASDALENSKLFKNRKKAATIDIETLQRIIDQDAPTVIRSQDDARDALKYCSVDDNDVAKLQLLAQKKALTSTGGGWGKVCVEDKKSQMYPKGVYAASIMYMSCTQRSDAITEGNCPDPQKNNESKEGCIKRLKKEALDKCKEQILKDEKNCKDSYGEYRRSGSSDDEEGKCICDWPNSKIKGNSECGCEDGYVQERNSCRLINLKGGG